MKRLGPVIKKVEQFIRGGEIQRALGLLRQIDVDAVAPRFCSPVANLMRRCGLFPDAMKLAQRGMRSAREGDEIHTACLAEYCTMLVRLGSVEEAGRRLAPLTKSMEPSALIARFWYHFTRFEYRESIPLLEQWIGSLSDPYLLMIAENNLAEAYFGVGKYGKSREVVSRTIRKCEASGYLRLLANGLHIRARCSSEMGDLDKSDEDLKRALTVLKSTGTADASIIRRQIAVNEAFATKSLDPINKFRESALRDGLWETLRELDFQSLRIQFRADVLNKLYFGTPYPAYRERIRRALPEAKIESEYIWGPRRGSVLDLGTGTLSGALALRAKPTRLNLLTLKALLQDSYRPLGTREIYAALFENEDFDAARSDDRIHQCIARLRRWLTRAGLPLRVDLQDSSYVLSHEGRPSLGIRVPASLPAALRPREASSFVATLREHFSDTFTASDVRTKLALSSATTIRRLTAAVEAGHLTREGTGKSTRYSFTTWSSSQ